MILKIKFVIFLLFLFWIREFSTQLLHCKLEFKAFKLFVIDKNLILWVSNLKKTVRDY